MTSMKWHTSMSPKGDFVLARLFSGETSEDRVYAGTLTLPTEVWEQLLDRIVHGAARMRSEEDPVDIFFGPDNGGGG